MTCRSASYEQLKRQLAEVRCSACGTRASSTQACAQTGQLEALRQQLREQLTDCGWREQLSERVRCPVQVVALVTRVHHSVRAQCRQLVRQRGYENLTVDQLAKELLPSGRAAVPDRYMADSTP